MLETGARRSRARSRWSPGSGNVAQFAAEKLLDFGAKPITLSDSGGTIHDPAGIDREKLA